MAASASTRPQGVRIEWSQVAAPVRAAVERELGSEVVSARNHAGGFSPGTAARVELADGRVVFVKAVSSALNDVAVALHRAEAAVLARLPPAMPVPRLQARIDVDVDGVDWVALVIDHVDGAMPQRPWRPDELARVLAVFETAAQAGTPCPVPDLRAADDHRLGGLARLDESALDELLDPWSRDHVDELVALEAGWREAIVGDTLLQFDSRADNMLLGEDRVWLVDWPHAVVGAPWVDLLAFLPSAVLDGAPDPEEIWLAHPLGAAADQARADAVLAAFTGFFLRQSTLLPPPGIPTVRAFPRAQGEVALDWLGRRLRSR
jgi:hypothetical protein